MITFAAYDDYLPELNGVTFSAGSVSASAEVTIFDDKYLEENERFILTLVSLSPNAGVGDSDQAIMTILDNDGEYRLQSNNY